MGNLARSGIYKILLFKQFGGVRILLRSALMLGWHRQQTQGVLTVGTVEEQN